MLKIKKCEIIPLQLYFKYFKNVNNLFNIRKIIPFWCEQCITERFERNRIIVIIKKSLKGLAIVLYTLVRM